MSKTLRPYQEVAADFLLDVEKSIYADPPGAGKTGTTSMVLDRMLAPFSLIVAPKVVLKHWAKEIHEFTGREAVIYTGPPKVREAALDSAIRGRRTLVTNYERFRDDVDTLREIPWQAFAFDEAHRLKNRKAKQTKAAWQITRHADQVILATGTPVMNRGEELWSLLHTLYPHQFTSYWRFVREHFEVTERWVQGRIIYEVGRLLPGHEQVLRNLLSGVLFQRPIESILPDLPEVEVIEYEVAMSDGERREYNRLADHNWGDFDGEIVSVNNVLSKMTRFRQVTSDWSSLSPTLGAGSKIKAVGEMLEDLGEPAVVMTNFKQSAYNAVLELSGRGLRAAPFTGDQSTKEREATVEAFRNGALDVIVGVIAAIGEGIDGLQVARHVVFIDRDYTPARNEQAIARIRRSGQLASKVVEHRFFMAGTIDQTIENMLALKQETIDSLRGWSAQDIVKGLAA